MRILALLMCALLAGCAGVRPAAAPPAPDLFDDTAFRPPAEPITTEQLFALSPAMREHLGSHAFGERLREKGPVRGLLLALYDNRELKLEYESTLTRTAAQTYADRRGNCLSLVIMTAAFAKELGLEVHFQNVEVEETWSRVPGLYLISSHVNLTLGPRLADRQQFSGDQSTTVDFLPPPEAARLHSTPLDEDDIATLYMNNRAAEALVAGRIDDAYWWARSAVARPGAPSSAFNTLAVIYQKHGDSVHAERVFRAALERDPDSLPVMQNLVPVLAMNGKAEESALLAARVARLDRDPPFRHFNEGMQAYNRGDYAKARDLFQRAVDRASYNDEFHFWLGVAWLRLGDTKRARDELALALDNSTRHDTRELYSAKLAHLRRLAQVN